MQLPLCHLGQHQLGRLEVMSLAQAGTTLSLTPNAIELPEDEWKELKPRQVSTD